MAYGRRRRRLKAFIKDINFIRITIRALFIFFIALALWLLLDRMENGLHISATLRKVLSDIYYLLNFPCVILLYNHAGKGWYVWGTFFTCLFLDAYLYSIAIAIILYL